MAKNISKYLPLRLINEFEGIGPWRYDDIKEKMQEVYKTKMPNDKSIFISDMIKFGVTDIPDKTDYRFKLTTSVYKDLSSVNYNLDKDLGNLMTDIKDILVYPFVIETWTENKQVYKLDDFFLNALYKTKNFTLTKNDIAHLPTNTFFIDLTEVEFTKPYDGVFVNVIPHDKYVYITIYIITNESAMFSHYFCFGYNKDNEISKESINGIMSEQPIDETLVIEFDEVTGQLKEKQVEKHGNITPIDISRMTLQTICYLTSKEPDIEESQKTKLTYRKPKAGSKPANTFKEVQIHEVGIRYGKSVKALVKNERKKRKENTELQIHEVKQRKSPAPHFRCAHWQRYWTGQGRTTPVVKWVEPMFIGFGEKKNTDIVIHRVK
jgi:hypothetical protein